MIFVNQIRLPLSADKAEAVQRAAAFCGLKMQQIRRADISRVSVDARRGSPSLVYTVALSLTHGEDEQRLAALAPRVQLAQPQPLTVTAGAAALAHRPVVCGFGPAGIFAALLLAQQGYRPIVLERGKAMRQRCQSVAQFNQSGALDTQSNIQFGEGGAGAFSDGKLTTRIHSPLCEYVTQTLLRHGAPEDIAVRQKPHIGTDLLRDIIVSVRREIERLGGEVRFETQLTDLVLHGDTLTAVQTAQGEIPCEVLLLCTGHSARDTAAMLRIRGMAMQAKAFSVGFRAEHLQQDIDRALYHGAAGHPALPAGEYQLSQHIGGRCVYTFCMCPGGQVVAGASEENAVVTNGMSYHARDGKNANAAVVVSVNEQDFGGDAEKAIAFQRKLERAAYAAGGGAYGAPACDMQSFLQGKKGLHIGRVTPTYPRGVAEADLGALLPEPLAQALRGGLQAFNKKLAGYTAADAVLTGLETRTSSPLRMLRGEDFQAQGLTGVYPCGEGAGYAGGIVSAAVDGVRAAQQIISVYKPFY